MLNYGGQRRRALVRCPYCPPNPFIKIYKGDLVMITENREVGKYKSGVEVFYNITLRPDFLLGGKENAIV